MVIQCANCNIMIEINTNVAEACGGSDDKWTATKAWVLQYCCTCAVPLAGWPQKNHDKWACRQCLDREGYEAPKEEETKRAASAASSTGTFDEDELKDDD
uniref:Uncharacterized protein n=1 Tax=Hemiselmis andersenii TaxID=464988 RepID=A0A6U5BBX1_HEMAN